MNTLLEKLLARTQLVGECLEWLGTIEKEGYGVIVVNYKQWRVHRLVLQEYLGLDIPETLCVCHTCNNKTCVNPKHLYLATRKQNSTDAAVDGLYRRKYPDELIKRIVSGQISFKQASQLYGISSAHFSVVKNRKFVRASALERVPWPKIG